MTDASSDGRTGDAIEIAWQCCKGELRSRWLLLVFSAVNESPLLWMVSTFAQTVTTYGRDLLAGQIANPAGRQ